MEVAIAGSWISTVLWLIIFILMVKERHHIKAHLTDESMWGSGKKTQFETRFEKILIFFSKFQNLVEHLEEAWVQECQIKVSIMPPTAVEVVTAVLIQIIEVVTVQILTVQFDLNNHYHHPKI